MVMSDARTKILGSIKHYLGPRHSHQLRLIDTLVRKSIVGIRRIEAELCEYIGLLRAVLGLKLGDHRRAMENLKKALHILEQTVGPNHESTIESTMYIGLLSAALGDVEGAVGVLRPLEKAAVRELKHTHVNTLTIRTVLRHALIRMGNYTEAEQLLETVLTVVRRHLVRMQLGWLVRWCESSCGVLLG
jgi:tetratricopeptide (TPR) repeat protein